MINKVFFIKTLCEYDSWLFSSKEEFISNNIIDIVNNDKEETKYYKSNLTIKNEIINDITNNKVLYNKGFYNIRNCIIKEIKELIFN